ncbi:MAG: trypsin-like peptidase domain-containing protein [Ruminococcus sp.]|nr:trypsin-like peptidase domain-containing protein [Ruminococcus sp.]
MSDYPFENFNNSTPEDNASAAEPESEQSASPESDYENIYANSADYKEAEQTGHVKASDENPYLNTDNASQQGGASAPESSRATNDYEDGFYHQRFSSQTGSHVNYTRPSAGYVDPQTSQPDPARYTATAAPRASQPYETRISSSDPKPRRRKKKGVRMTKGGIALLLVVCVLLAGAAGFGGSILAAKLNQPQLEETDSNTMVIHKVDTEAKVAGTEALVDKTTAEITAEVADTVVEITTEVMQTSSFYGQYIAQGAGSGVIISNDGYILTNNHVIDGASSIKVTTRGGDSYDAKLIGTDAKVDIAVLKIEATDLPTAVFGDSDKLTVGSKAVIIGNPLGTLGGSVTEGIISALDRSIVIDDKTMHLMQTDAAINPGNSGGGMFNGQGELAGIVVAKSSSEEIDNIGFVIPINNVLDILGDLKDYGYVRGRADTGMTFIDLSNQMYAYYYYGNNSAGVYISSVENGSNAAQAGFKQGDRVISVDGKEISEASEIESLISEKSAGDTVTFDLERGGSKGTLELTLQEDVPDAVNSGNSSSNSDNGNSFGNGDGQTPQRPDPFGGLFG